MAESRSPPPRWLFALELGYLAGLVVFLILYGHWGWFRRVVPDPAGPVPLGVIWWGALGGVTISLSGVFKHPRDWNADYNNWHIARPALGAVIGTVGFLIFFVVLRSTGANVPRTSATFYVVAFIVGYREDIFRTLLKRAADLLFSQRQSQAASDDNVQHS